MIAKTILHYKILDKLGEGGMGVAYKALDLKLDRFAVLKFLPPDLSRDRQAKERFIVEAKAASSLDHPNVCTIYEINETEDGQLFIAMAYYEGETLREQMARGKLQIESVIGIVQQIAGGLARAHEMGIVHRDIKPSNIIITKRNEAKIIDFGLAKLAGQQQLTKTGATMGTIAYMSPEQAQGLPVDHRTDIWSLGVVMYEMLTAQFPFQGHQDQAVMYAIVNSAPKPVRQLRPDVPAGLARVVERALNKHLSERYQLIDELLHDLKTGGQPTASNARSKPLPAPKTVWKKRWLIYAGLVMFCAALILAGFRFFSKSSPAIDSIAVLPLQNLSGDPEQEYFADGMTEALIANLAKIKSLRVISRTSVMQFKNTRESLPEIAKKLNVDAVVEGSVTLADGRVHITAQLIEAATDRHLWAAKYDRNLRDVLALQTEIVDAIVGELSAQLTPEEQQRITNVRPVNPEAYQFYLKGRNHVNNYLDYEKAVTCFQQAVKIDQSFGRSYAALAASYLGMRITLTKDVSQELSKRARAAATKGIQLDDTIGEVHAVFGDLKFFYEWDWSGAEQEYSRALLLEPQNTEIIKRYADYLVLTGRFDEGIALQKRAIDVDPLSAMYSITLGWSLFYARRYDEGITHLRKMLLLYPNESAGVNYQIAWCYAMRGMHAEAIKAAEDAGGPLLLAYVHAVSGNKNEAHKLLVEILKAPSNEQSDPFSIAVIYAGLNDKERALGWLNKAYYERSIFMTFLKTEPTLDPIRSDQRYIDLCQNLGFIN